MLDKTKEGLESSDNRIRLNLSVYIPNSNFEGRDEETDTGRKKKGVSFANLQHDEEENLNVIDDNRFDETEEHEEEDEQERFIIGARREKPLSQAQLISEFEQGIEGSNQHGSAPLTTSRRASTISLYFELNKQQNKL
jgi:hypothetical protein